MSHVITLPLDLVDPAGTWARVAAKLTTTDPAKCWEWTGATDPHSGGYGMVAVKCLTGGSRWGWRAAKPHRVAWTILRGPIPDGMVIDHVVCGNRVCCNPDHLEVVTQSENARRSAISPREECGRCGGTDWMMQGAQRRCRPCWNLYFRDWQRARAAQKQCLWCGADFTPTMQLRKLCSDPCKIAYRLDFKRRKYHEVYKHQGVPEDNIS